MLIADELNELSRPTSTLLPVTLGVIFANDSSNFEGEFIGSNPCPISDTDSF